MTPIEILHKIVETDNNAKAIYNGAVSLRDGFEEYVMEHVAESRKACYEKVNAEIEASTQLEKQRSDKAIAGLDAKLEADLQNAKQLYEKEKDAAVEKVFKLAVNLNA